MDCCLLCLEQNKEIIDSIETNSKRWEELSITPVLEKHFWSLNIIHDPYSWLCSICWQEVDNFHKFYLRIEEAHANFGKINIEEASRLVEKKDTIVEEMKDLSCCLEPEILIDQNKLKCVVDIEECSLEKEKTKTDLTENYTIVSKDPLKKAIGPRRKNVKCSKRKSSVLTRSSKSEEETFDIKREGNDSENNDNGTTGDDNDDCDYEQNKNPIEHKKRKDGDQFIAEHFKEMFCDLCNAAFKNFNDMKKHFLSAHSINTGYLVCCTRKFYQRNHLVDHLQCHLNPDYFKCNQCGKVLLDRKNLEGHILRVHRPEDIVAKHSCDVCGKAFTKAFFLKAHKLKHLPEEEKKFPCTQCGKFYASPYLLKRHTEVVHLKKQAKVCYICGKTLPTTSDFKAHMNKHEGIPAPVIHCNECGLRLSCERHLKLHKESQHPVGGKKDHPCPMCDRVSPSASALKKHINIMHEKGLDHKCTTCGKAFRRPEALKEHMASHTGIPLYACPWCTMTFNSNGNMHAHRKNKHPKEYLEQKMQKYF